MNTYSNPYTERIYILESPTGKRYLTNVKQELYQLQQNGWKIISYCH